MSERLATTHYGTKFHRVKTHVRSKRWDVSFCGHAVDGEKLLDVPDEDICTPCRSYPGQREFPLT